MKKTEIDSGVKWLMLQHRVAERNLVEIFVLFRKNEIEPILIKGWAAGLAYPEPFRRSFSDIDLAVEPKLYERAVSIVKQSNLNVDLHEGLRHHDTVGWADLLKNSILVEVENTPIRILRPEDHLRVLCVHWLNDGGAYRERLYDIFYAVENRPENFDWERCLNVVSERRRRWIICAIGLAHKYLNLYIDDLPFGEDAKKLPKWLVKEVEKEWASDVRLIPIHQCLHDKKAVWQQIRKRIPPNAIQATIESEGDFDAKTRVIYQALSFIRRMSPSFERIREALLKKQNG